MENTIPAVDQKPKKAVKIIRNVYLYLVSMIGLVVFIFGAVGLINTVFQNYVFQVDYDFNAYSQPYPAMRGGTCAQPYPDSADKEGKKMITPTTQEIADCNDQLELQKAQNRKNRIGQDFSIAFAQMAVGLPVWLFHWGIIQKEAKRREDEEKN